MRSLHGHSHLCIVVSDHERGGRPIHLIVSNGAPVWQLFQYFQSRNLNFSTEASYAHAIGLFLDFLAAKAHEFSNISDRSRLMNSFAHSLLLGTVENGDDPSGLWWHARKRQRVKRILGHICEMSDWLHHKYEATAINPFNRPASVAEQLAFWRRWNTAKAASMLKHTKSGSSVKARSMLSRAVAFPGGNHVVADVIPAFPEHRVEELLFEGFILSRSGPKPHPWLRWNIRDMLITLLMHYGGLRVSEPMHLWVDDVYIDPRNPKAARVLVHHPLEGVCIHPCPATGQRIASSRLDYLKAKYNRRPITETTGKGHAGWKNSLLTHRARNAFEVFWFPQSVGELFLSLYRIYIKHVRPISVNHPYLFVTQNGEPLGVGGFSKNYSRAVKRIGLEPLKHTGTTPHGHRHAYGQRLKDAGVATKDIQVAMHHVSPLSQDVYTKASAAEVRNSLESALPKLSAAGLPFAAPSIIAKLL